MLPGPDTAGNGPAPAFPMDAHWVPLLVPPSEAQQASVDGCRAPAEPCPKPDPAPSKQILQVI